MGTKGVRQSGTWEFSGVYVLKKAGNIYGITKYKSSRQYWSGDKQQHGSKQQMKLVVKPVFVYNYNVNLAVKFSYPT